MEGSSLQKDDVASLWQQFRHGIIGPTGFSLRWNRQTLQPSQRQRIRLGRVSAWLREEAGNGNHLRPLPLGLGAMGAMLH
jgi:hypothetical protein